MTYLPARDFIGYGDKPPAAQWPGGAKLALNIVVNYEEGAEYSIGEGDGVSEAILSDLAVSPAVPGLRNRNMNSTSFISSLRLSTSATASAALSFLSNSGLA